MQGGLIAVAVAPHAPRLGIEERVPAFQRGLIDGMLAGLNPPLAVREFRPLVERTICKVSAG